MDTTPQDEQKTASAVENSKLDLEALARLVLEIMRRELLLESDRTGN